MMQVYSFQELCRLVDEGVINFLAVKGEEVFELTVSKQHKMLVDQHGATHTLYSLTTMKLDPIIEKEIVSV